MPDEKPEKNDETTEPAAPEQPAAEEQPASEPAAAEQPAADEQPAASEPAAAGGAPASPKRAASGLTKAERRAANKKPRPRTPEERLELRRKKATTRRAFRAKVKAKRAERRAAEPAQAPDQAAEHGPGRAKTRQGIVVSDKADKTITVRIDVTKRHRRYGKILRTSTTLHAHDERNDANAGDTVRIVECRPLSRTKRWRLTEVVGRAK